MDYLKNLQQLPSCQKDVYLYGDWGSHAADKEPDGIDQRALNILKSHRNSLTRQQLKTLRGQIMAGDAEGAMRGLKKLLTTKQEGKTP